MEAKNAFRRPAVAGALVVLAAVFALMVVPYDLAGRFPGVARWADQLHAPVMAGVTVLLAALSGFARMTPRRLACLAAGLLAFCVIMELVQPFWGRSGNGADAAFGCSGVLAGAVLVAAVRMPRCRILLAASGLLFVLAAMAVPDILHRCDERRAAAAFPLLAGFETRTELSRWEANGCGLTRDARQATEGQYAGRVAVVDGQLQYPGIFLTRLPMDWRGFEKLRVDVVATRPGQSLWLRVDDRDDAPGYNDRYQGEHTLTSGLNRIEIRIAELVTPAGRSLELDHIAQAGLFLANAREGDVIYVDDMRLVNEVAE